MELLGMLFDKFGIFGLFVAALLLIIWRMGKWIDRMTANYREDVNRCFEAHRDLLGKNNTVLAELKTLIQERLK